MTMTLGNRFSRKFDQSSPGLIVFLVDQSGSMGLEVQARTKASIAAEAVNRTIEGIIERCRRGIVVENKATLGVIGYGAEIRFEAVGTVGELDELNLREETVSYDAPDDAEEAKPLLVRHKVWLEPRFENTTPMAEALNAARERLSEWVIEFPEAPAPVVINVTDGAPNDLVKGSGDQTRAAAKALRTLDSAEERCLLMSLHIGREGDESVVFPNDAAQLRSEYERLLFDVSSALPPDLASLARTKRLPVAEGSRLLAVNTTPALLLRVLDFGSSVPL